MAGVVVPVLEDGEPVITVLVTTLVTPPLLRAAFARAPEETPVPRGAVPAD